MTTHLYYLILLSKVELWVIRILQGGIKLYSYVAYNFHFSVIMVGMRLH